jgi:hypothetical protein
LLLLLCACGDSNNLFHYDDGIEIVHVYTPLGEKLKTEISLSDGEIKNLIDSLSAYNGKWLKDRPKFAFSVYYRIRLDNDTVIQIAGEGDGAYRDGRTHIILNQLRKDGSNKYNKYAEIDSSIIAPLEEKVANKSSIFVYSDGIEINYEYYDGLSSKNIEIDLSEEEIKTLVRALAWYDGKLLDDQFKCEVTSSYLIRFDEDTYARIGAEDDYSSKDGLVYMYVADQGKYKNVYINSAIIAPLEAQRARAE